MQGPQPPQFDIRVDEAGDRVWVTGADGSSIGRFNKRFGIDVHTTATEQMAGAKECLFCTHGRACLPEWDLFREKMLSHYHIDIAPDLISFDIGANNE